MKLKILAVVVVLGLLVLSMSAYTVKQSQTAILVKLGQIKKADIKPGLHWKWPLIEQVKIFDHRILTMDAQPERFLTSEKKNVIVDYYVKWRIANVNRYYRRTLGDEIKAQSTLSQIVKDGLRSEFGKRTIQEAVSGERNEIMDALRVNANKSANELGIEIVDVRLSQIDLPNQVSSSVYQRMEAERARVAADFRARGKEAAEGIRAKADRERTVLLADAYRESQRIRGQGDAKAAEIYARAYEKNPDFYAFYRSLNAYKDVFNNKKDILLLEPDSDFFKYFNKK